MVLRESADYHGEFSKEGAKSSIESAAKFLQKQEQFLNEKGEIWKSGGQGLKYRFLTHVLKRAWVKLLIFIIASGKNRLD